MDEKVNAAATGNKSRGRIVLFIVLGAGLLVLGIIGGVSLLNSGETPQLPQPPGSTVDDALSHPSDPEPLVLTPLVGAGKLKFGMTKKEVFAICGEPDKRYEPERGMAKYNFLKGGMMCYFQDDWLRWIMVLHSNDPITRSWGEGFVNSDCRTLEGLKFLDDESRILALYGEPDSKQDIGHGRIRWQYLDASLMFIVYEGKCVAMHIFGIKKD